ncbi:3'5'-cyclic nucleotide phosphodiesterase family protein [Tritrichomonas foetus]|uniref:3'5'-cyclic nucleotide phosphodiesterase family protein n=1 Tax=Tritrichomonas foetus TaxID=1144522 RepID=A0A1J4JMX6_9EUKA|nr:3'5'-cyclic nucleotide phosphodiesterase family protein [Tritrichomonas foetus]|eukprot:OHT00473.1 3'5'-cyclic nucleotide phosphodiesterase family protein [Tritrichomonas foetus]
MYSSNLIDYFNSKYKNYFMANRMQLMVNKPHSQMEQLPNPQNPYARKKKANFSNASSFTSKSSPYMLGPQMTRSPSNPYAVQKALPPLKESKYGMNNMNNGMNNMNNLNNGLNNNRSQHTFSQTNEKYLRHESVLEAFLVNTMTCPLHEAIEQTIQLTLKAATVTLWQDIPTLHMLYSRRLDKSVTHSTGLIGFTFFSREVVKIDNASAHAAYSSEIDGIVAPGQTPMILFPLWDSNNNVCAVVQVTRDPKDPFFDEDAEDFIQFFIQKYKIYSHWLSQQKIPHEVVLEVIQVMQIEQFLLTFNKKITALFECNSCELWRYNLSSREITIYKKNITKTDIGRSGIVGESLNKECPINCAVNKMQSSYLESVDGNNAEPVLVVPILDVKSNMKFAICLRGRKYVPVFSSDDERLLRLLAPYFICALDNCERYSSSGNKNVRNAPERQCVNYLDSLITDLTTGIPIDNIIKDAVEKTELLANAERSYLFVYDKENELLTTKAVTNIKQSHLEISSERGIVGKVYKEKNIINVPDAYVAENFDSSFDLITDFKTTSLLTVPVLNNRLEPVGVFQMLNKKDGKPFSNNDIRFVKIFMTFCGLLMENDKMYFESSKANLQVTSFVNIAMSLSTNNAVKSILNDILQNARKVINAERASLFLVDDVIGVLSVYLSDGGKMPQTIPMSHGIAATTVKNRKAIIVNDAYHDPRFNKMIDYHTGFKTQSVVTAPVISSEGDILGVAEMINKENGVFTNEDCSLLQSFATFAAVSLEKRRLKDVTERGTAEIEMSKWIGEYERKSFEIPTKLVLPQPKQQLLTTLNYFSIEWNGIGLFKVAFHVFNQFNLLEQFDIHNDLFFTFLYKLRECYNEPPYHNWIHAIDVLQYFSYQIHKCCFHTVLTGLELFSICVAAISHDAGHEGFNNIYNVNSETPLGILFKDQSVMETFHCTVIIRIIAQDECNIFHALSGPDLKRIWGWIIQMILATDMAHHFKLVKSANDIIDQGPINLSNQKHRLMAMTMLMKVSDISNVSRPFEIADKWCDVLCEEFWRQGDMELAQGHPVSSSLNERGTGNKPKGQVGFYNFVCLPLYQAIARIFPELEVNLNAVKSNLEIWKTLAAQSEESGVDTGDAPIPMTEQPIDTSEEEEK